MKESSKQDCHFLQNSAGQQCVTCSKSQRKFHNITANAFEVIRNPCQVLNVMKTKTPEIQAITAIIELIIGMTIKDIGARLKKRIEYK